MSETIEVRWRLLGTVDLPEDDLPIYHMYVVYTDSNGGKFYARGGPGDTWANGFGPIVTEYGEYTLGTVDYDVEDDDPRETIISDDDLSDYWNDITNAMDAIEASEYGYGPLGQNSNATVIDALDQAGLSPPTANPGWSPGAGFGLHFPADSSKTLPSWIPDALSPFREAPEQASPLVIDLDGDGIELTEFDGETTTTFFDIDGDGFAEQAAWVGPDDALLARDVNENGVIDDVTELFGSPSVDGFALLVQLDSNGDLVIDANDEAWDSLLVWQDANGDAISQAEELTGLETAGIKNIRLDTVQASTSTIAGNPISHTAVFTWDDNSTDTIGDAWFVHDAVNTFYSDPYTLDARTLFLPTLRGFGEIADLHIAMSQDEDLLEMVADLAVNFEMADFADGSSLDDTVTDILFTWAGVDGLDPESRGPFIDARKLVFLEKFFGEPFYQVLGAGEDPYPNAAAVLENSWHIVFQNLKAALVIQAGAAVLFEGAVSYNAWTGEIEGALDLEEGSVGDLADNAPAPGAANENYWIGIALFLDAVKGLDNLSNDEDDWLDAAVQESDATLTWDEVKELIPYVLTGSSEGDTITGTSGVDTINAGDGDDTVLGRASNDVIHGDNGHDTVWGEEDADTLYGDSGNDIVYGGSGADHLYGGDGNDSLHGDDSTGYADILEGGAGGNSLFGGSGDDEYVYGGGTDFIEDTAGTDEIQLPSGVTSGDITVLRLSSGGSTTAFDDLLLMIDGAGTIQISNGFSASASSYHVETLVFYDTSTLDLTSLSGYETLLTAGNDNYGLSLSSADAVQGLGGNDQITTGNGNDTLDGGDGNDQLSGGEGDDTYVASAGLDTITESGTGTDVIEVPDSVDPDDVYYYRVSGYGGSFNDLRIYMPGLGEITVLNQFYSSGSAAIEQLFFAFDESTVTLTGQSIETRGSTGSDFITGATNNASADDILNGLEGDDTLQGGSGDDTYVFSEGNDAVYESSGSETIEVRGTYAPGNLTIRRAKGAGSNYDDLLLSDSDGNTILIQDHFYATGQSIEYVHFANDTLWTLSSMEIEAHGTASADQISGVSIGDASSADTIYGYGGNDNLSGQDGNDILYAGDGDDNVYGDNNDDTVHGEDGNDLVEGGEGNDTLYGEDDADTLKGGNGNDNLLGGAGNDTLYGEYYGYETGNDVLEGGAGNDALYGGSGTDVASYANAAGGVTASLASGSASDDGDGGSDSFNSIEGLTGSAHNDTLTGDSGANALNGGAGDDTLAGGSGDDTLDGGTDNDTVSYLSAGAAVSASLSSGTATGEGSDTLTNIENIIGSAYNDTLTGDGGDNILAGGAGNDSLDGGSGTDTADYRNAAAAVTANIASGTASTDGDGGSDTFTSIENILGSAYNDTLTGDTNDNVIEGGAGNDTLNGGAGGTDTLSYASAGSGITISLASGSAQNTGGAGTDTVSNFDNIIGSAYADTLTGGSSANVIYGMDGVDTLYGGNGDDTLHGGNGDDTLRGWGGADTLNGDAGADTLYGEDDNDTLHGGDDGDTLYGDSGDDTLYGEAGNDNLYGGGNNDTLYGGAGNDTMDGVSGNDTLYGGDGTDTLNGGNGADTIYGDADADTMDGDTGNDDLYGGAGADTLYGDTGNDDLYGGAGADTLYGGTSGTADASPDEFFFEASTAFDAEDTIIGFSGTSGDGDKINLFDVLDGFGYDPLTHVLANWVNITTSGSDSTVQIDRDGTGSAYSFTDVVNVTNYTVTTSDLVVPV